MENITLNVIHKDLEQLKKIVFEMKASMANTDSVLNKQDFIAIEEYDREKENGTLFSHEEIKKSLMIVTCLSLILIMSIAGVLAKPVPAKYYVKTGKNLIANSQSICSQLNLNKDKINSLTIARPENINIENSQLLWKDGNGNYLCEDALGNALWLDANADFVLQLPVDTSYTFTLFDLYPGWNSVSYTWGFESFDNLEGYSCTYLEQVFTYNQYTKKLSFYSENETLMSELVDSGIYEPNIFLPDGLQPTYGWLIRIRDKCGDGYKCTSGGCLQASCTDSDGFNFTKKGTCIDSYGEHVDNCSSATSAEDWSCTSLGGYCQLITHGCPYFYGDDYVCQDGACIEGVIEENPVCVGASYAFGFPSNCSENGYLFEFCPPSGFVPNLDPCETSIEDTSLCYSTVDWESFIFCPNACEGGVCVGQGTSPPEKYSDPIQEDELIKAIPMEIGETCTGCFLDKMCYMLGYRKSKNYCDKYGFVKQKNDDMGCKNSFECKSNLCISEKCVSESLWNKFIEWLKAFLNFVDDAEEEQEGNGFEMPPSLN